MQKMKALGSIYIGNLDPETKEKILIIFEMANNHMGDVDHGKLMIQQFSHFINKYKDNFNFAWKFQFRNLETFIHKNFKNDKNHKYVKRFQETSLTESDFVTLK